MMTLSGPRLDLVLQTPDEVEHMIESLSDADRAEVSPDWLARVRAAREGDPWALAFRVVERSTRKEVGMCSFKGPPLAGIVEIAYGIDPGDQRKGFATEAARLLVEFAVAQPDVAIVRAHTLPDGAASKRVLEKCGFAWVGNVIDPDDGEVSRFEYEKEEN